MFLLSLINITSLHLNVSFQTFILNQNQAGCDQLAQVDTPPLARVNIGSPALHQYNKRPQRPCREAEGASSWEEEALHQTQSIQLCPGT